MEPSTEAAKTAAADHLCVIVHGLWGNPQHMNYLVTALREKYGEDQLHILVTERNSGNYTYDGVELGGERVTQEVEQTLERLEKSGQKIKKISFVGYSMGGLVSRYAIGLLYSKGWFDRLEPVNFTTFATPHLGIRTPKRGYGGQFWNVAGARTLALSGRQLFMVDRFRDTGRPILSVLADPDTIFMRGLATFQNRFAYCNIKNDRSTVFYTTSFSRTDPFADLDKVKLNFMKGYDTAMLDPINPVTLKEEGEVVPAVRPGFLRRVQEDIASRMRQIPRFLLLLVFIPLGLTLFLANACIQSVRSRQRIRLHETGKAGIVAGLYRLPLMVDDVRRRADGVYENLNQAQSQEYLPAGHEDEELGSPKNAAGSPRHASRVLSGEKFGSTGGGADAVSGPEAATRAQEFPTLALTPDQFEMIDSLDQLGWKKFPVYISEDRHAHAAIIVRMPKKTFWEGMVVVRHWLTQFEV